MNNLVIGLKKFFTNKNVVTIILVLVALGLLFWGYTSTIKKETNPIKVPVAAVNIPPRTKLTSDMIKIKEVANSLVDENVITSKAKLINSDSPKYTTINVTIPEGSMFYKEWIVEENEVPGLWIDELDKDKELPYYLSVNMESTYGNAILPESYIDFYLKATDANGTITFGRFMKDIKVLVVHNSKGQDVFADSTSTLTPAKIGFGVSKDYYILLTKIKYLNVDLILVPRGMEIPYNCDENENCTTVTSKEIRDYIDSQTITIEEDVIVEEEESTEESETDETQNETQVE